MFVARMGLPCPHILQSRASLEMPLFDAELVNKRWSADYYQTPSQVRFTLHSWNDVSRFSDAEISSKPKKAISTQAGRHKNIENYKKLLIR